jgi:hypothetical protein
MSSAGRRSGTRWPDLRPEGPASRCRFRKARQPLSRVGGTNPVRRRGASGDTRNVAATSGAKTTAPRASRPCTATKTHRRLPGRRGPTLRPPRARPCRRARRRHRRSAVPASSRPAPPRVAERPRGPPPCSELGRDGGTPACPRMRRRGKHQSRAGRRLLVVQSGRLDAALTRSQPDESLSLVRPRRQRPGGGDLERTASIYGRMLMGLSGHVLARPIGPRVSTSEPRTPAPRRQDDRQVSRPVRGDRGGRGRACLRRRPASVPHCDSTQR